MPLAAVQISAERKRKFRLLPLTARLHALVNSKERRESGTQGGFVPGSHCSAE